MAQSRTSKIRTLRQRGKGKLVKVNDHLNSLTWDLFERNSDLKDVNATRAIAVLDDALSLIQRAGALLNSVHVEEVKEEPVSPEPNGFDNIRSSKDAGKRKPNLSRSVTSVN
ncbi:MAG TPA: hypothetical protein DIC41_04140 [Alphaproteobacteria bacterium]|jgi:hypothetical protein|nr:hypothetical protein [Rhodospirillaceae bacterium]MBL6626171.1 hypothetical protein [Alphaproteobacteria bacterium]PDH64067.1 MAG: hypothetical protein CNE92_03120 [SAR116 cluster bacterium MED-G05]MAS74304.1 hypothetical protein [Rhodospirillaceae bacterium]MBL6672535.1 hypothetical protein [Alphaproteobacteria bacterium]|tara:strand:- start:3326 stop:3661 length:336 start_codon:yes stop_codon:yes gene_type:complete